ncbi:MAG: polymerase sigma-54 factor RpoN, partial [Myxococcaceae bacterium]|nr:polymerase sigma-54 factor RpoN [Myxococcaceae bacterium]
RILGNEADAREVLQDLFVSLLERPEQLAQREAWSSYLYAATTHACLNRLRNQRNRARLLAEDAVLEPLQQLGVESLVVLRHALRRLPEELATVAVYYYLDGMNQQEIADQLGCSRRHVGHLLERVETWGTAQEAPCLPE